MRGGDRMRKDFDKILLYMKQGGGSELSRRRVLEHVIACILLNYKLSLLSRTFPSMHYEAFACSPKANLGPLAVFETTGMKHYRGFAFHSSEHALTFTDIQSWCSTYVFI